jgi:hypothetical protein
MYLKQDRTIYLVAGITDMRKQINGCQQSSKRKWLKNYSQARILSFWGKPAGS